MGSGLTRERVQLPSKEVFQQLISEYDKLKFAGLSSDEVYEVLSMCIASNVDGVNNGKNTIINNTITQQRNKDNTTVNINVTHKNGHENHHKNEDMDDDIQSSEMIRNPSSSKPAVDNGKDVVNSNVDDVETNTQLKSKCVALLIDDSPVANKITSKVLQNLNFDALVANSAHVGFNILRSKASTINIVFLDVVMPNVDGVECLAWIKGEPTAANIPVYMLSGLQDQTLTEVCLESGAEGMLLKPLDTSTLKRIIKRHNIGKDKTGNETKDKSNNSKNHDQGNDDDHVKDLEMIDYVRSESSGSCLSSPFIMQNPWQINFKEPSHSKVQILFESTIQNTIDVSSQATAFRLTDHEFTEFVYPSIKEKKDFLFVFIPTIFMKELYDEDGGFLRWLASKYELIRSFGLMIVVISIDLPATLLAGKKRFNMPYRFLADPTLCVCKRYIGTMDIGNYLYTSSKLDSGINNNNHDSSKHSNHDNNTTKNLQNDHPNHLQHRVISPHIGMILVNKYRYILRKWVAVDSDGNPNPKRSPPEIREWLKDFKENADKQVSVDSDHLMSLITKEMQPEVSKHINTRVSVTDPLDSQQNPASSSIKSVGRVMPTLSNPATSQVLSPVKSQCKPVTNSNQLNQKLNVDKKKSENKVKEYVRKYILVVDDSSVSSRVLTKKLESLGYLVSVAYNGLIALDMLKKEPQKYGLVLTDIVMPVCDGIQFLRMVKAEESLTGLVVILLSGMKGIENTLDCRTIGAVGLMKKPFDIGIFSNIILEQKIANLLE